LNVTIDAVGSLKTAPKLPLPDITPPTLLVSVVIDPWLYIPALLVFEIVPLLIKLVIVPLLKIASPPEIVPVLELVKFEIVRPEALLIPSPLVLKFLIVPELLILAVVAAF
jgi:hypothetical protein